MKLFNTLSGEKEELDAPRDRALKLFVCGPTIYDTPHIGNARTFMSFDILVRYLRSRNLRIIYIQNITDIDDKIIDRAKEEKTDWESISRKYERIFLNEMKVLDITSVDMYARATRYIPEIVSQVKKLLEKGHAYLIEGDGCYFDLKTFPEYGKLSRRTTEQAEDGTSRIDISDKKRNRGDFVLWKLSKDGEPGWMTELGFGRPGWHIEDTAITEHFFGPQYDLHGGGIDIKFPHHEAEIAQQESASGLKPFVKYWLHAGSLTVNGEKMSKSLKNFITLDAFLREFTPEIFRMLVFMHHYRSPMDYTNELASIAKKNLSDIAAFTTKLESSKGEKSIDYTTPLLENFYSAMDDDLNTPKALAAIFGTMNEVQPVFWTLDKKSSKSLAKTIKSLLKSAGIELSNPKIPLKIRFLARRRELYRRNKQFEQSDAFRKRILELGYTIEDTPRGPFLWTRD